MRNHVVEKVLKLTRRKEKYLVVAAVRFLRTCIALKVGFTLPLFFGRGSSFLFHTNPVNAFYLFNLICSEELAG